MNVLKILECINNGLVNILTCESAKTADLQDLRAKWEKRIWYATDEQLDRYINRHGLQYYSVKDLGRYKVEKMLIDYFVKNEIEPYYI